MRKSKSVLLLLVIALSLFWAGACAALAGIIPVTRFNNSVMQGGVPEGWTLEKKAGAPSIKIGKDGDLYYLNFTSAGNSSFGVRRETRVDIKKYPILCWRWKVDKLPTGGDVRKSSTDDQALQVYVAFKEAGFLGMNTPVVGYIWDTEAPKGWSGRSPQTGGDKLRYIVLRNKTDNTGQWYTERRNVYRDYKRLFADVNNGEPQGLTTGLQFHINSQHTRSQAESMIGDVYFSDEPADIALAEAGTELGLEKRARISAIKPPVLKKKPAGKLIALPQCLKVSIEFDTNGTSITEDHLEAMQKVTDYLTKNAGANLNIVGHSDNVGSEKYNLALSARRAASVKNYLVEEFGIDPERLIEVGVGFAQPMAGNDTPEGRRQNRRVLISDCPENY